MTTTPTPPETLREALAGRYQLLREVGRGGMATVYLANDEKHNRQVAVKVLKPDLAASLGADRFLREIQIAANLNHPHIVPLLDSANLDGALLYVMPFVEGESLRSLLEREKRLPVDRALAIATEVAGALTYAHRQGVVHRDIKPENILLNDGHAVVADFGIAKAVSSLGGQALTRTGFPIGTPGYMSPEQATGVTDLDERSDVFSLGCVIYEMLLGDTPRFWITEEASRLERLVDAPANHRALLEQLPGQVERGLVAALALKAELRPASPSDLIAVLEDDPKRGARRRYSDTEVRDIVKHAAESEARPTDPGMTIGAVQALGSEVGIAPERVAHAAAALERTPHTVASRVLGSPEAYHSRFELPGPVDPGEQVELLNVVRQVLGQQGKAAEVMGSLEWRNNSGPEGITVTVTARRDSVGVTLIADRRVTAMLTLFLSLVAGVGGSVLIGEALQLQPGALGGIGILAAGATSGLVAARAIFVSTGKSLKGKLDRVRGEMGKYLERGGRG